MRLRPRHHHSAPVPERTLQIKPYHALIGLIFEISSPELYAALPERTALQEQSGTSSPSAAEPAVGVSHVEFNSAFVVGGGIDLSRFSEGNPAQPGRYRVDMYVNGDNRGKAEIEFQPTNDAMGARPVFTLKTLDQIGVDIEKLRARLEQGGGGSLSAEQSYRLEDIAANATASYDAGDQQLNLTIPQIFLRKSARGYVDPSRWDRGDTAGLLQYTMNTYSSQNVKSESGSDLDNSAYLGLDGGFNLAGWRVRQRSTLNWRNSAGSDWNNLATYVQRDLPTLRSQFTLGDSYTTGDIFDSFGVRGVQLATDDRMLPESLRGYAPQVRGVAETNAKVTVKQNGNVIYQTTVPPGPFDIDDLYATGYGGDLEVTVTEADGRERRFSVPFAAVTQLLRAGVSRYNFTAGKLLDTSLGDQPTVVQGTLQHGLTDIVTAYGGTLLSSGYSSGLLGAGVNTPVGAIALDVTLARTDLQTSGTRNGQSWRASYSKLMPGVGTNLTVAAYRYSTEGFYTLREAAYARNKGLGSEELLNSRVRSRVQVNLTQPLGDLGSAYLSASSQNYWSGTRRADKQYQAGYNGSVQSWSYNLYLQHSVDTNGRSDNQFGVSVSVPLGGRENKNQPFDYINTSLTQGSGSSTAAQVTASGTRGENSEWAYGLNANHTGAKDTQSTQSIGGYTTYRASAGTLGGTVSAGNATRQASISADGSVVLHRGGVTFGPQVGDAFALIEAKGAEGATVINGQGAVIDSNGYALVPNLTPYRINTVGIDPKDMSDNVELDATSEEVVPTAGSMLNVKFLTKMGRPLLITLKDAEGVPLQMGSSLFDSSGNNAGIIGQGGIAFVRGLEGKGALTAKWGTGKNDQCVAQYSLSGQDTPDPTAGKADKGAVRERIERIELRCLPDTVPTSQMADATSRQITGP
ncbi:fimbria/pilus outer membrane usher protein [Serratia quinivorans]|uniref:fimbria/pilus outer membrane usher protein n=1 Tax=Serratia quinivorans TaxID=137545 RepID=UPI001C4756FD|nr:fimbrial biogenesis outer membrane usher protein [Serratia quinivorans]